MRYRDSGTRVGLSDAVLLRKYRSDQTNMSCGCSRMAVLVYSLSSGTRSGGIFISAGGTFSLMLVMWSVSTRKIIRTGMPECSVNGIHDALDWC